MFDGAMFLPEEVMISSFLRSITETKPSSSMVPMSPVCTHVLVVEQLPGVVGPLVVAAGVDRAADQDLAVVGERHLDARVGRGPTVPSRNCPARRP